MLFAVLASFCLHKANAVLPNAWVWDSLLLRGRLCVGFEWRSVAN
jgi:hypothetical protein